MGAFDYEASAELYSGPGARLRTRSLKYQRFERAAEAIRHVMEELPAKAILGCSLDVAEARYAGNAILPLYESPDYPLPRRRKRGK
jgi:hypothetical protein